ncbi:MAG: hydroxyacylglutathione hydrolase [Gammaproteobacteria bacterium]|nr:hydroxyacylglutathione hydrolase [Gammaproteobacteria bacterium]
MTPLDVSCIPAFTDNYLWLLTQAGNSHAVVVDPGDATVILSALQARRLQLSAILVTHHHRDHVGGILTLLEHYPQAEVWGPFNENIPGRSRALKGGEQLSLPGLPFRVAVLAVPGHTLGHIAYLFSAAAEVPLLFGGDTLFGGGCGRLFEGSPAQMLASLTQIAGLPADTLVYCGHEYTAVNLAFAQHVEPDNKNLQQRIERVQALRAQGYATVPFTLGEEWATNPFLRADSATIRASAEKHAGQPLTTILDVFTHLRHWKNHF